MYHFFVQDDAFYEENKIRITGDDVNHMKNVLRLKEGEQVVISCPQGQEHSGDVDYYCHVEELLKEEVILGIDWTEEGRELENQIYLFQGLPKSDKMELIIQKAVELGAYEIIPVAMKRSVVKIEPKKEEAKIKRWQGIAESAAKQSKRSIIPRVAPVMTYGEALEYAKNLDVKMMPYENARGIAETRRVIGGIEKEQSIGILIGPEGGFDPDEVEKAKNMGYLPLSLGKRILRTETAGMMMLSVLMYSLEDSFGQ